MYEKYAQQLIDNGYQVVPIYPGTKRPVGDDWIKKLNRPPQDHAGCGIGIVCGVGENPVYAVDIDVTDQDFNKLIGSNFDAAAPVRVGKYPKRVLLFRGPAGLRKITSAGYDVGKLECLGDGQQFVAFGIHPVTKKEYSWGEKSPLNTPTFELPELPSYDIVARVAKEFSESAELFGFKKTCREDAIREGDHYYDPNDPLCAKPPIGVPIEQMYKMLKLIDPDVHRDVWRNIGFAIHHETDGGEQGLQLWDAWSKKGAKYKEGETEYFWGGFGRSSSEPITAAYLIKVSKEAVTETLDSLNAAQSGHTEGDPIRTLTWDVDRFASVPPEIEMVIYGMLPKGITGMLYSAGGVGKSTLLLNMLSRIAAAVDDPGVTFLGHAVNGGQVVLLTAEDPDVVLNRRYVSTLEVLADERLSDLESTRTIVDGNLKILSTFGSPLHLFDVNPNSGTIRTTRHYESLVERLKTLPNLQLVVVDTKSRYSPGEGQGNVVATHEIAHYEAIVKATGATVILLHHTNKVSRDGSTDGQQAYRDATGTFDAVRAAWYLRPLTDKERKGVDIPQGSTAMLFENSKNSYVPQTQNTILIRTGFKFEHRSMAPQVSKAEAAAQMERTLYTEIIRFIQTGTKKGYTQSEIVEWSASELQCGRRKVTAALEECVEDELLTVSESGRGRPKMFSLTEQGAYYGLGV